MTPAALAMLGRYRCTTRSDYENALKEIIQEIALLGLWRAKFFEVAAFYGGTALRIFYGLDRFSEDLDFSLLQRDDNFNLQPFLRAVSEELTSQGFAVEISERDKAVHTRIESAFIKANTKAHLIKIEVPEEISDRIHGNDRLKIKLEVDTDPPGRFETEVRTLLQPIPFTVKMYKKPDLFAGKIHAILQRNWKSERIKGRDFYDFVWYVGGRTSVHLEHLEERLRQTSGWSGSKPLRKEDLLKLLAQRFSSVDIGQARNDVLPFLSDASSVDIWSNEFLVSLLERLEVC